MKKRILFVCSTGIATSTMVAEKVIPYLEKEKGMKDLSYTQTNVASVKQNLSNIDLIVTTTNIPYQLDVPVVKGIAFLTGVGEEKILEEIYDKLTK